MSMMATMMNVRMARKSVEKTIANSHKSDMGFKKAENQPTKDTHMELEFQVLTGKYGKKVLATYKTRGWAEKYAAKVGGHVVAHWF